MARFRSMLSTFFVILAAVSPSHGQQRIATMPWRQMAEKVEIIKDIQYAKADEVSLRLDMVQPKAENDKPRPVWCQCLSPSQSTLTVTLHHCSVARSFGNARFIHGPEK